jgi:hypothetical protein
MNAKSKNIKQMKLEDKDYYRTLFGDAFILRLKVGLMRRCRLTSVKSLKSLI